MEEGRGSLAPAVVMLRLLVMSEGKGLLCCAPLPFVLSLFFILGMIFCLFVSVTLTLLVMHQCSHCFPLNICKIYFAKCS